MSWSYFSSRRTPVVWAIAGSDSCGGAGLQADLQTIAALGAHPCTVVAALTAQNTARVHRVESVTLPLLAAQVHALQEDLPPGAVKIGMLGGAAHAEFLQGFLPSLRVPVVLDPVLAASSGTPLLDPPTISSLRSRLFPLTDVLTPNLAEAAFLVGRELRTAREIEGAAEELLELGPGAVVIKGGHGGGKYSQDFYRDRETSAWLTSLRIPGSGARGTGCTFASAVATALAHGFARLDSVVIAKTYVNRALRDVRRLGQGSALLRHQPWEKTSPEDLPWITGDAAREALPAFPSCGPTALDFYPIVPRAVWLERLLPLGVTTAQLRIKDLQGDALDREMKNAILVARRFHCRLFINDEWRLAIKHGAYGVHLGQEDLLSADIDAVAAAGLRLGLSTHSYAEIARAHSFRPSYMAIGPIFPTQIKVMRFGPQGIGAFRDWRRLLAYPVVAIGGISLEKADALLEAGADSLAVVSDIVQNPEPETRARAWLERCL